MQGKVVLSARILKDGRVGEVRVMSGPPVFQQSAVDAVKQWRYKPAHLDGEPVESTAEITLNFSTPR
jgi:protein TonB